MKTHGAYLASKRDKQKTSLLAATLCLGCALLWFGRPTALRGGAIRASGTHGCLSNQERIGLAFAQYMQDFDGKFPRGTDPEDKFNSKIWRQGDDKQWKNAAQSAPMLPDLLLPYLRTREVWRCPDDIGYETSRLPGFDGGLTNVHPSSFKKYGMSYYYLTLRGFREMRAREFQQPSRNVSLFDGDLWHGDKTRPSLNALFVDGHVQNLNAAQFNAVMNEMGQGW